LQFNWPNPLNLITLVTQSPDQANTLLPYKYVIMKIEYHNLYTHFILITQNRVPSISPNNRERIEKYITGVINNNNSKLYSIYANPEHIHMLASRSPKISEEVPPNLLMKINLV
jgi:Transposase IS200 like